MDVAVCFHDASRISVTVTKGRPDGEALESIKVCLAIVEKTGKSGEAERGGGFSIGCYDCGTDNSESLYWPGNFVEPADIKKFFEKLESFMTVK